MANWVYLQVRITLLFFGIRISLLNLRRRDVGRKFGIFPEDAGDFIPFLIQAGLKFMPAAVYEDQGRLVVSFEEYFLSEIPSDKSARDQRVSNTVVSAIKRQIPELVTRLNKKRSLNNFRDRFIYSVLEVILLQAACHLGQSQVPWYGCSVLVQ
jgi:hypothetical protein